MANMTIFIIIAASDRPQQRFTGNVQISADNCHGIFHDTVQ